MAVARLRTHASVELGAAAGLVSAASAVPLLLPAAADSVLSTGGDGGLPAVSVALGGGRTQSATRPRSQASPKRCRHRPSAVAGQSDGEQKIPTPASPAPTGSTGILPRMRSPFACASSSMAARGQRSYTS